MSQTINVALASYGMSGEVFHAPLIAAHPHFQLKTVVERHREKSKEQYPEVSVVKNYEALLNDAAIDLIVVNTPNPLHFEMCKQALEAGKHVIIEKPFTNTTAEAETLIRLAQEKNLILTVFQNRRWDSDFMTVQKVVNSGLLGDLVEFEAHYDRYRNYVEADTWKEENGPGAGILYNLGSHMIDQALVLFGLPKNITATLGVQRKGGHVNDYYHLILGYDAVQVILKSSYLVREHGPRYILHGNLGSFLKYGLDPQEDALKAGIVPGSKGWGEEPESQQGMINTAIKGLHLTGEIATEAGNYLLFYDNVYKAIREQKPLAVKPEEARDVIRVIEGAIESNKMGKRIEF
jgi:predicted dehydrogenase